jgi:hypothetical protein
MTPSAFTLISRKKNEFPTEFLVRFTKACSIYSDDTLTRCPNATFYCWSATVIADFSSVRFAARADDRAGHRICRSNRAPKTLHAISRCAKRGQIGSFCAVGATAQIFSERFVKITCG